MIIEADLVGIVQRLVRIPSVTGLEGAVQQVVASAMGQLGLIVDTWEPTVEELVPYAEHAGRFESRSRRVILRAGQHRHSMR